MKTFLWRISLSLIFLLSFCLTNNTSLYAASQKTIRVAILKDVDNFILAIQGLYTVINPLNGQLLDEGRMMKSSRVMVNQEGISIGQKSFSLKRLRIVPKKDVIVYNKKNIGKKYREAIDIIVEKNGKILVVNVLGLERYVRGVLYHEVTDRWPMEAMKAQAVATRSYALYQEYVNRKQEFDVTSDIYSQVFGGKSAEKYRTNLAVDKTKGQVLIYDGEILPAYFHANSGGHTENVSELWGHDMVPLAGREDPFAPEFNWKKNFQSKSVQEKLNAKGYAVGLIGEIKIVERNESGRVKKLEIISRDGQSTFISGKDFRQIVGPNEIKSNLYEIEMKGYYFDLVGRGWGHGVGLCQWGAYQMSREHYGYKDILAYYYPGAKLVAIEEN